MILNSRTALSKFTLAAVISSVLATSAIAQARSYRFDIANEPLSRALRSYSQIAEQEIIFTEDVVAGFGAPTVKGEFTPQEALEKLLEGTGLIAARSPSGAIMIRRVDKAPRQEGFRPISIATDAGGSAGITQTTSEASAFSVGEENVGTQAAMEDAGASSKSVVELEEVLVTGTNIRNVTDQFSPVISVDRDYLDTSGFATVGDFIAQLPQNFGGGTSATADRGAGSPSGVGASTVNLRGMGSGATLTLLNGRRMAPSGTVGNYVDISAVPTAAIERVDVLTDGASAIYGSDAIAGVVNFILRKDYNGAETRVRLGTKTEGDANDYQIGQTFGISNERGRALLSYEYSSTDALNASDRRYTAMLGDLHEILPASDRNAAFFSGGLPLGSSVELFMDLNYSDRHSRQVTNFNRGGRLTVTDVKNWGGAAGAVAQLGGEWRAEIAATSSTTDFRSIDYYRPTLDGYGGSDMWNDESVWSVDTKAEGPLFTWWGGTVRAMIGSQYREESHDGANDFLDELGALMNQRQMVADNDRQVSAAYTEIYAPLVSEANGVPGVRSLALNVAGRYEDYSDFGTTFNPKFGVLWSPVQGLTLRGSYGKSFRAPPMYMLIENINFVDIVDYIDPEVPSGRSVAAYVAGNSRDLKAEESTSWLFGLDFRPAFAPGFSASITYYDIEYSGRIATPYAELDSETYEFYDFPLPVDRNVDLARLQSWAAQATYPSLNYTTLFPWLSQSELEDATVLLRVFPTNTAVSRMSGIDANLSYDFSIGESRVLTALNASYALESENQFSPLLAAVKTYDRMFYPAPLRMRGGAMWSLGGISANLFANYVASYDDDRVLNAPVRRVDDWLTFDLSLQYDFDRVGSAGLLSGTKLTLSVNNILDKVPPRVAYGLSVTESSEVAYDSANADPDGRMIALQLIKQW